MKESFIITTLSRSDFEMHGYKGIENISDEQLERIAIKMEDAYISNQFWSDLEYFAENELNLKKVV